MGNGKWLIDAIVYYKSFIPSLYGISIPHMFSKNSDRLGRSGLWEIFWNFEGTTDVSAVTYLTLPNKTHGSVFRYKWPMHRKLCYLSPSKECIVHYWLGSEISYFWRMFVYYDIYIFLTVNVWANPHFCIVSIIFWWNVSVFWRWAFYQKQKVKYFRKNLSSNLWCNF